MTSVVYRVGVWIRRNLPSTVLAAVVLGAALAPALALAAGARRTGSLAARYSAAHPTEFDVDFNQLRGPPVTSEIAALPVVDRITAASFVFGGLIPAGRADSEAVNGLIFVGDSGFWDGPLIAGRRPDPAHPGEFAASADWAALGSFEVGDRFTLVTVSAETAATGGFENEPDGPSVDATLVGIWEDLPAEQLNDPEFTAVAVFPSSLLEIGSIGLSATVGRLATHPGTGMTELRDELDTLDVGQQVSIEPHQIVPDDISNAVHLRMVGFMVLAIVAGVTAIAVVSQLLARQFGIGERDRAILTSLGYTRQQVALEQAGRAALATVAGAVVAAVIAWLVSGRFPYGFGATLEPDPGRRLDPLVHVVAAMVMVAIGLTLLLVFASRRAHRRRTQPALERVGQLAPTMASAVATRWAFGRSRASGSTNGALAGVTAVVAVTIAALVVGSSLHDLLHTPARWGNRWDLEVGQGGDELPTGFAATLSASSAVEAVTLLGTTEVQAGSTAVPVVAFDAAKGSELPEVLEGRLPTADRDVAISTPAKRRLGVDIGDQLTVQSDAGQFELSVVGVAVVPAVEGVDAGDPSVLVDLAGYHIIDPTGGLSVAGVVLVDDASDDTAQSLANELGAAGLGQFGLPPRVLHLRLVEDMPGLIAAVVGALAAISATHLLVAAVRRRRFELEVLRALGGNPRWLWRIVSWQTALLAVVIAGAGGLVGLTLGRLAFGPFPEQLGASPGIRMPWCWLGITILSLASLSVVVSSMRSLRRGTPSILRRE